MKYSYGEVELGNKVRCSCGGGIKLTYSRTGMGEWFAMVCVSCGKEEVTSRMKTTYDKFTKGVCVWNVR